MTEEPKKNGVPMNPWIELAIKQGVVAVIGCFLVFWLTQQYQLTQENYTKLADRQIDITAKTAKAINGLADTIKDQKNEINNRMDKIESTNREVVNWLHDTYRDDRTHGR